MLAKTALLAGILSWLLMVAGVGLAHGGLLAPVKGMGLFALGGVAGLGALVAGLVVLVMARSFAGAAPGLAGVVPLAALLAASVGGFRYPPINDITTDLVTPPVFTHAAALPANEGRPMDFDMGLADVIREAYEDLAPLELNVDTDAAFQASLACAREGMTDWAVVQVDEDARVFEAVASTWLFRFKDDIVVRVTEGADGGSVVDMRSKSRDGKSDLGANAKRIRAFFARLRATS